MIRNRTGRRRRGLDQPPVDKMRRAEDVERKGPMPEEEADLEDGPAELGGIDRTVRDRGAWFPGDSTL